MRADAAVNCGNTLAAWAELLAGQPGQGEASGRALMEAESCYQAALQQENDALVGGAGEGSAWVCFMIWWEASREGGGGRAQEVGGGRCEQSPPVMFFSLCGEIVCWAAR